MANLIFLASPYWHRNLTVRRKRVAATRHICCLLTHQRFNVYSPVVYHHTIWEEFPNKRLSPGEIWYGDMSLEMLERSTLLWVLMLPGYERSAGIMREVGHARRLDISVLYLNPALLTDWDSPVYLALDDKPKCAHREPAPQE